MKRSFYISLSWAVLFFSAGSATADTRSIGSSEDSSLILTLSVNSPEPPKKIGIIVYVKEATDMRLKIPIDLPATPTGVIK